MVAKRFTVKVRRDYNRPSNSIGFTKETQQDKKISNCTDCKYGIFKDRDKYTWTRRGFVHQECEDRRINEIKNAEGTLPK